MCNKFLKGDTNYIYRQGQPNLTTPSEKFWVGACSVRTYYTAAESPISEAN